MSSRCSVCASDDFFEKQWILACRCNEDVGASIEWDWCDLSIQRNYEVFESGKSVIFHPLKSQGTAIGAVTTPSVIFDLPGFPPGLQSMLKNNLPWLFCQARSSAGKLEKVESTTLSKNAATADCLDRLSSLLSQSPRIPSQHSLLPATSESVEDHPGPSTSTPPLVSDMTGSLSSTASHAASLPELSAWRVLDNLLKMASTEASPRFSSSPPTCCTLGRRGAGGETELEGSSDAHPAKSLRLDGPVSGRQLQHPQPESPNSTDFVFAEPGNKAL
nr:unnamed protein product [Spirometra erinaceieuropaei]